LVVAALGPAVVRPSIAICISPALIFCREASPK
jgi:hypothetical protein